MVVADLVRSGPRRADGLPQRAGQRPEPAPASSTRAPPSTASDCRRPWVDDLRAAGIDTRSRRAAGEVPRRACRPGSPTTLPLPLACGRRRPVHTVVLMSRLRSSGSGCSSGPSVSEKNCRPTITEQQERHPRQGRSGPGVGPGAGDKGPCTGRRWSGGQAGQQRSAVRTQAATPLQAERVPLLAAGPRVHASQRARRTPPACPCTPRRSVPAALAGAREARGRRRAVRAVGLRGGRQAPLASIRRSAF